MIESRMVDAADSHSTTAYLFVYGSLRRTAGQPMVAAMQAYAQYLDEAWLNGRLYQIDTYPGAILSPLPTQRVYGELYRIHDSQCLFAELDDYEECAPHFPHPHEYRREQHPIHRPDKPSLSAWVYVYNHAIAESQRIASGDWLEYLHYQTGLKLR